MRLFAFFILLCLSSCNLFFEKDLSKVKVDLLSPPNAYTTYTQTQTFVWDSLPNITHYRFQIVSKRFDYIENYVLDTSLNDTRITLSLQPKEYQWRVIAYNNSSETDYNINDLIVVQDTSLANQIVNTIAPNGTNYTSDSVAFWWSALGLANQYQLQVATHPSFNSQTIRADTLTANDYCYLVNYLGLGTFHWRIRAMRAGIDTTPYTAIQTFTIDAIPVLQTPSNNSQQNLPFNMSWTHGSNLLRDSLLIYYNNTNTPYKRLGLTTNNYTFNSTDTVGQGTGTYYWKVKSVGTNNIESSFSDFWQFTIN